METPTQSRVPFADNGARIRRARKRKGLSQENLALTVGTSRRHMIRLENGQHLPSGPLRDGIAAACDIEPSEIQSADDEDEDSQMRDAFRLFVDLMAQIPSRQGAHA
jgi:transcriptional regulator with XRE-family HTH domain